MSRTISGTSPRSGLASSTRAPAERNAESARSNTERTSSSIVMRPPRSAVDAIFQPFTDGVFAAFTSARGSTSYEIGERSSAPAITDSISPVSAIVRAIGPSTE